MSRKRKHWHRDVYHRYNAFSGLSKEAGKTQFLRIIHSLPYGMRLYLELWEMRF